MTDSTPDVLLALARRAAGREPPRPKPDRAGPICPRTARPVCSWQTVAARAIHPPEPLRLYLLHAVVAAIVVAVADATAAICVMGGWVGFAAYQLAPRWAEFTLTWAARWRARRRKRE